jgi:hypothetical protein
MLGIYVLAFAIVDSDKIAVEATDRIVFILLLAACADIGSLLMRAWRSK